MKSLFKTKTVEVDGLTLTVRELSAGDHMAVVGAKGAQAAEEICKRCVLDWKDETIESIRDSVPARLMTQIVAHVFEISGLDVAKNSEPAPSADSSTV